jgi:hypothetical protein
MTVMLSFCLVLGDNRRNPYSRAYSTMYFSSGHTRKIKQNNNVNVSQDLNTITFKTSENKLLL